MNRWRFITTHCLGVLATLALMICAVANGEEPPRESETLVLKSGDELEGVSLGFEGEQLRWQLPSGGIVGIPLENVERLEIVPQEVPAAGEGEATVSEAESKAETKTEEQAGSEKEQAAAESASEPEKPAETPPEKVKEEAEEEEVAPAETAAAPKADPNVVAAKASESEPPPVLKEPLPITEAWYEAARSTYAFSAEETDAWTKRFEFGGTWVEGNSNTTEAYVGGVFERQYETVFHQLDWNGRHTSADNEVTQSRWQLNGTTDFSKNQDGNWILFTTHKHLFDQLADLNYRGTFASGIGYRFFNEGDKRLIARIGPGATIEKYDPPEGTRLTYDAFTEIEARWPILDRTHLEYKSTFTPSMEDISVFRVTSNYGLLVALDESEAWAMKLGLRHDHNSDPNPDREKDDFTTMFSVVYSRK